MNVSLCIFYSDISVEGQWRNYYTGDVIEDSIKGLGGLDIHPVENCGTMMTIWRQWIDVECVVNEAFPVACACQQSEQMYLQLRGLCLHSNIDRFYVPRNVRRSGAVQLVGLDTSSIDFNKEMLVWTLTEHSANTTAVTKALQDTFALGSHEWLIKNDNIKCSTNGEPYKRVLKLSGCRDGEFTCSDGQCIRNHEIYPVNIS